MATPPNPNHYCPAIRRHQARCPLGCPVGGQPRISQRSALDQINLGGKLPQGSLVGHQLLGKASIRIQPREAAISTVHVFGSDYAIWTPKWIVEAFARFELPEDLKQE